MPTDVAPRLETPRLLLRGWTPDDVEPHMAMDADPEVMRWLGGPIGRVESWRRAAQHAGHWLLRGYGNWVVERREDGCFLGRVGLYEPEGRPRVASRRCSAPRSPSAAC